MSEREELVARAIREAVDPIQASIVGPYVTSMMQARAAIAALEENIREMSDDYKPGWDDRKELAEIWQEHAPLPAQGLRDGVYDALIAVAIWGYNQRKLEED